MGTRRPRHSPARGSRQPPPAQSASGPIELIAAGVFDSGELARACVRSEQARDDFLLWAQRVTLPIPADELLQRLGLAQAWHSQPVFFVRELRDECGDVVDERCFGPIARMTDGQDTICERIAQAVEFFDDVSTVAEAVFFMYPSIRGDQFVVVAGRRAAAERRAEKLVQRDSQGRVVGVATNGLGRSATLRPEVSAALRGQLAQDGVT